MKRRFSIVLTVAAILLGTGLAIAQTKAVLKEKPEKLADPAANALQDYLYAQYANDKDTAATLKRLTAVTDSAKERYVSALTNYLLWMRYLERRAIEKWGKEDGMRILGHVRTFDDQYVIDSRRVREANVQYNSTKTTATIHLRIEMNRPENLQMGDSFNFLDSYEMIKVGGEWKLDFLKTYKKLEADDDEDLRSEMMAIPRMTKVIRELCEQMKASQIKTADEMKNILEDKWSRVYDDPVRTTVRPDEQPPAP
ncbi:MAG: hypothetical protein FWD53_04450 [Phycisphaerales bacterium]|nr:hypothetical protein [Phycisphaerales bacterium]